MLEDLMAISEIAAALYNRSKSGKPDDLNSTVLRAQRVHRRIEAILMHPLSSKVIHPVNRPKIEAARDVLRKLLSYSPLLGEALGQHALDANEVIAVEQEDGSYLFSTGSNFDREKFERSLYSNNPELAPVLAPMWEITNGT